MTYLEIVTTKLSAAEDRIAALEARCADWHHVADERSARIVELEARCRELEAALRQIVEKPSEDNEWDGVDKYRECQEIAAACFTKETPDERHGRIVNETADAIASQMKIGAKHE